jgi:site-specific recombinase XerD
MKTYDFRNERIKRRYVQYLKEVRGHGSGAVDQFAKAIDRFEGYTRHTDFAKFHIEQVKGFKRHLLDQVGMRSGEKLSAATIYSTLRTLRAFFTWLAGQSGYKKRFQYGDWEYFNPSRATATVAKAHRTPRGPTVEQVSQVLAAMPSGTDVQRRDRALIALIAITGARVNAVASLRLRDIDVKRRVLMQDARTVMTKFGKTFDTWFFPVGDDIEAIIIDWVRFLADERQWTLDDPLFPATKLEIGESGHFEANGLTREHWSGTGPIRMIFREAFERAGVPYFNPHSFRNMIVAIGSQRNLTWQEMQAWAQNLGHESLTTTFGSYGQVAPQLQGDLVRNASAARKVINDDMEKLITMVSDLHSKFGEKT